MRRRGWGLFRRWGEGRRGGEGIEMVFCEVRGFLGSSWWRVGLGHFVVVADWLEAQKFRFDVGGIGDFHTMHEHRRAVVDYIFPSLVRSRSNVPHALVYE